MKSYYVASSLDNILNVRNTILSMAIAGFKNTYDWSTHGMVSNKSDLSEIAQKEMLGVVEADFLILLMPAKLGSHVEFGIALALNKPVFIIENNIEYEEKSFYNLPNVCRYQNMDKLLAELTR
jgi:hypothetical protein